MIGELDSEPAVVIVNNCVNNSWVKISSEEYLSVTNPSSGAVLAQVAVSNAEDVDVAVKSAAAAFPAWSGRTLKSRADILRSFHTLVTQHATMLAECIVQENGKNITEAHADLAKGLETLEYAAAVAVSSTGAGRTQIVSSGPVTCQDSRKPLGVVVSIVPFNFPFMVPMWTVPMALVMGNTVVLKPSEKVPITMYRCMALWIQAGLPPGCLNLVQGSRVAVEALLHHPVVQAVTFVGSSPVAAQVALQCRSRHKRCTALGGAKNHLVALPDCHISSAAADITVSFAGCAGQRCMAASVLLLVGEQPDLIRSVVDAAAKIQRGTGPGQMGPVIDEASYEKIISYIQIADESTEGAKILLDGRSWQSSTNDGGHWIGPTVILHSASTDRTLREEVFGPVLSMYQCKSWQEAIEIENASPFGNAAAIYTTNGGAAEWFLARFKASMLGCNIGIPVPREPFSFGGLYGSSSKYGDMDITGESGMEFFTHRIKVTSRWPTSVPDALSGGSTTTTTMNGTNGDGTVDHANFAGRM